MESSGLDQQVQIDRQAPMAGIRGSDVMEEVGQWPTTFEINGHRFLFPEPHPALLREWSSHAKRGYPVALVMRRPAAPHWRS
jgi:hypothetical protein